MSGDNDKSYISYALLDGKSIQLQVITDNLSDRQLIVCDICGAQITAALSSSTTSKPRLARFDAHRGSNSCEKASRNHREAELRDRGFQPVRVLLPCIYRVGIS